MPVEHHFHTKGVYTRYLGRVTGEELVCAAMDMGAHPEFDDWRFAVGDWSECTDSQISVEDIERLCAQLRPMAKTNPNLASLVVMRPDMDGVAFTNLYMFLSDELPWFVMGYRSIEEVKVWLRDNLSVEL